MLLVLALGKHVITPVYNGSPGGPGLTLKKVILLVSSTATTLHYARGSRFQISDFAIFLAIVIRPNDNR